MYQYKDHLGNIRLSYTDNNGNLEIVEENNYYPFGLKMRGFNENVSPNGNSTAQKYKTFQGQEFTEDLGLNTHEWKYRISDPAIGRFWHVDPLAHEREWLSPYNFVQNNPLSRIDPDGALDEPVYGSDGTYRGDTKEGFTGEVIIYDGDVDFSKMSASDLLSTKGADTYDNQRGSLTGDAKSNIWTHIVSQLEEEQIYDEKFSLSSIEGGKIHYDGSASNSWESEAKSIYPLWNDKITGSDKYLYSTTVENIQSSVVVHEWYSHIKKNNGDGFDSHRLAYKNVINFKSLWNNTTDGYKGFNMRELLKYTKSESNNRKTQVDPLYRNLYRKYHKKYD
ncbi:MAG: hypothetical protein CR989_05175 [Flavobacteriales bacterium]|nr:MAG: hypothetical protein CR989_05175 [Flavobacteriales bacterium]